MAVKGLRKPEGCVLQGSIISFNVICGILVSFNFCFAVHSTANFSNNRTLSCQNSFISLFVKRLYYVFVCCWEETLKLFVDFALSNTVKIRVLCDHFCITIRNQNDC